MAILSSVTSYLCYNKFIYPFIIISEGGNINGYHDKETGGKESYSS